ncbi:hypothetical protein CN918_25345 [Priestia megaterium]|nr:hypothetical protein CN918_25345 [Priestia megaterium]
MHPYYLFACASVVANVGFCIIIYRALRHAVLYPESYKVSEVKLMMWSVTNSFVPLTAIASAFLLTEITPQTKLWPIFIIVISVVFSLMTLCLATAQLSHKYDVSFQSKELMKKVMKKAYGLLSLIPILSFISILLYGALD